MASNLDEVKGDLYDIFNDAVARARDPNGGTAESRALNRQAAAGIARAIIEAERLISPINP